MVVIKENKIDTAQLHPDDMLNADQMAMMAECCPRTVHRLVSRGQLPRPVISSGKVHRWRWREVKQHFDRRAEMG